jgi:demethylmenaquinone methyltransferase/2-methoxy-6-polyprenyl-1,4-benzoquinol methylase
MLSSVRPPRARAVSLSEIAEPNSPHAASAGIAGGPDASPSPRKLEALELFDGLERRYDALSAAFSFWQDPRWRSAMVDELGLRGGERILDVATGTGLVAAEMRARADLSIVAVDQSPAMLAGARARFAAVPGSHVELVQAEAERLPFPDESFDAVSFTYLLRYVDDPPATMRELARVLRPGGTIGSVEFGVPRFAPARAAWRLYTEIGLPLLGRAFSREWEEVGRFLGPSIRGFYEQHPQERVIGYWREAGLEQVALRRMSFGAGVVMSARKAPRPAGAG